MCASDSAAWELKGRSHLRLVLVRLQSQLLAFVSSGREPALLGSSECLLCCVALPLPVS